MKRAVLAHPAKLWLINTDFSVANGYGTKMSPRNHSVRPRGVAVPRHQSPQTRAALSTIASRTGCTSVGERLMMPSTSDVAV